MYAEMDIKIYFETAFDSGFLSSEDVATTSFASLLLDWLE